MRHDHFQAIATQVGEIACGAAKARRTVTAVQDPFAVLGLTPSATLDEVRAARRRLAKEHHPDKGGDHARMGEVNRAFDLAVKAVLGRVDRPAPAPAPRTYQGRRPQAPTQRVRRVGRVVHDNPSFTIDVLPVEAWEALSIVATWQGQVLVDDPPYLLEVHLFEPYDCWCRLDLLPEAGGTMVAVSVAGLDGRRAPDVEAVRDLWIAMLNELGDPDPGRS